MSHTLSRCGTDFDRGNLPDFKSQEYYRRQQFVIALQLIESNRKSRVVLAA